MINQLECLNFGDGPNLVRLSCVGGLDGNEITRRFLEQSY